MNKQQENKHADDCAVDKFAQAMKAKLADARAKGRGGWQECSIGDLSRMLREHVEKGDPRDVANFCMFLWHLKVPILQLEDEPTKHRHWNPVYNTDPVQRACGELPEFWEIQISLERDGGCVELRDPDGEEVSFDDDADKFEWKIHQAIDAAQAKDSK